MATIDYTSEANVVSLFPSEFIDDFTLFLGLDPAVASQHQPVDILTLLRNCISTVERDQWRFILRKSVVVHLPANCISPPECDGRIYLPYGKVSALTSFTYIKEATPTVQTAVTSSDYTLHSSEPSWLWNKNWYSVLTDLYEDHPLPITITYTTGYSTFEEIPWSTLMAIKILAYHQFVNRGESWQPLPDSYTHHMMHDMLRNQRALDNV
jgi:hypothetical protein